MMKKIMSILSFITFLFLNACATHQTQDFLNSKLGKMNYEEAIQAFGPPTNCAEAGSTRTCIWIHDSGQVIYAPVSGYIVGVPIEAPSARLTFTNGILTRWELRGNWK